jgi:acyl transferase domain-containing protein
LWLFLLKFWQGLAIGSNVILTPELTMSLDNLGLLSPDSHSYSFDSRANGYARGEGIGVIVIKRFDNAIRDGDTIRAVIRSSSSNQDGKTPGITQPSKEAQVRLIRDTYKKAGLDMSLTRYFEAHGTGIYSMRLQEVPSQLTRLRDPNWRPNRNKSDRDGFSPV